MIERITQDGADLALILRHDAHGEGIQFFTPDEATLQLGYANHPSGHVIVPHLHQPVRREVHLTREVVFVRKGSMRIDFYDEGQRYVTNTIVRSGDVVLLNQGGHGFEMLEPTELVEVKQGPYLGNADRTQFAPTREIKSEEGSR